MQIKRSTEGAKKFRKVNVNITFENLEELGTFSLLIGKVDINKIYDEDNSGMKLLTRNGASHKVAELWQQLYDEYYSQNKTIYGDEV